METLSNTTLVTAEGLAGTAALLKAAGRAFGWSIAHNAWGVYCVPDASSHRPAPEAVLSGGIWEKDTLDWIFRTAGRGDLVHAGAYFGDFLPALAATRLPGERVWAFEPNEDSFLCAATTILLNGLDQVTLVKAALSDHAGSWPIRVVDECGRALGGASRVLRQPQAGARPDCRTTQTVALDDVLTSATPLCLIHLDVEDSEPYALAGGWDTIERYRPALVLETVPPQWMEEELSAIGYKVTARMDGNTAFECAKVQGGDA